MDYTKFLKDQYNSTLNMLVQAVEKCPDELWNSPEFLNKFWHISYHALYFADLYTQKSVDEFSPYKICKKDFQFLKNDEINNDNSIHYTKSEILGYYQYLAKEIPERLDKTDMEDEAEFYWIPFSKYELNIYNIKHIQHHTGQLFERLRNNNVDLKWVISTIS